MDHEKAIAFTDLHVDALKSLFKEGFLRGLSCKGTAALGCRESCNQELAGLKSGCAEFGTLL